MSVAVVHADDIVGPVTWTVPPNETWHILGGHIILTTSATGGNRWVRIGSYEDPAHIVQESHAGAKQSGSLIRHYNIISGTNRETAFVDDEIEMGISTNLVLNSGWTLILQEAHEIDLVNDIFNAHILIEVSKGSSRPRL